MRIVIEVRRNPGEIGQAVVRNVRQQISIQGNHVALLRRVVEDIGVKGEWIMPPHIKTMLISHVADARHGLEISLPRLSLCRELAHQVWNIDRLRASIAVADTVDALSVTRRNAGGEFAVSQP